MRRDDWRVLGCRCRRRMLTMHATVTAVTVHVLTEFGRVLIRQPGRGVLFAGVDEEREGAEQEGGKSFHSERAEASGAFD